MNSESYIILINLCGSNTTFFLLLLFLIRRNSDVGRWGYDVALDGHCLQGRTDGEAWGSTGINLTTGTRVGNLGEHELAGI